eukprot:1149665-Pelagomonas_calceolata.AAC.2
MGLAHSSCCRLAGLLPLPSAWRLNASRWPTYIYNRSSDCSVHADRRPAFTASRHSPGNSRSNSSSHSGHGALNDVHHGRPGNSPTRLGLNALTPAVVTAPRTSSISVGIENGSEAPRVGCQVQAAGGSLSQSLQRMDYASHTFAAAGQPPLSQPPAGHRSYRHSTFGARPWHHQVQVPPAPQHNAYHDPASASAMSHGSLRRVMLARPRGSCQLGLTSQPQPRACVL